MALEKMPSLANFLAENHRDLIPFRDAIISEAGLSSLPVPGTSLSVAYTAIGAPLSIPALLELWESGAWCLECPKCGGGALVLSVGGSPLSGSNHWSGRCPVCGGVSGSASTFRILWREGREAMERFPADPHTRKELALCEAGLRELGEDIRLAIEGIRKSLDRLEQKLARFEDDLVVQSRGAERLDRLLERRREFQTKQEELRGEYRARVREAQTRLEKLLGWVKSQDTGKGEEA